VNKPTIDTGMEHRQAYSVHQKQSIHRQDSGTTIIGVIIHGMTRQVSLIDVLHFTLDVALWFANNNLFYLLVNPPEYCDVYEDQKSGRFDNTKAVASMAGRTDVEG
jgi:hypothetical protein